MTSESLRDHLITLLNDYRDLNSAPIVAQVVPTAVEFAKQVSKGYPCVYEAYTKKSDGHGGFHVATSPSLLEYSAFTWTKKDLVNLVDGEVQVAVTPNGKADDLHHVDGEDELVFLTPATVEMTIEQLFEKLSITAEECRSNKDGDSTPPIYYLQSQNSNLTSTPALHRILKQIPPNFPFAEPVLSEPEAINIWIGDNCSITSTHRDPYENLYLVLKGSKTFTLYPPVDEITLPTAMVKTGTHVFDPTSKTFSTKLDDPSDPSSQPRIPWVTADPLLPRSHLISQHPIYEHASPRQVTVKEGQILYLPSGWYHHVQQECGLWDEDGSVAPCIAVNYWFDMEYEGEKYVMRQFVGRLKGLMEEIDGGKEL